MATITQENIGRADGKFDKDIKAIRDKVVLKKCERFHEENKDGIIIPSDASLNGRANTGIVVSMGPEAQEDLEGLKVGDKVLYDFLSVYYDTDPIVITKSENIICKVEED